MLSHFISKSLLIVLPQKGCDCRLLFGLIVIICMRRWKCFDFFFPSMAHSSVQLFVDGSYSYNNI